jgi:hypothetical protein
MKRFGYLSILLLLALSAPVRGQTRTMQNCIPGTNSEQRQQCDEEISEQLKASSETTVLNSGWRLVKSRNPGGGAEAVSVMHVVDSAKSDLNLAGLSLRCGREGFEVLLFVLERLPRASHPTVTMTAGSSRSEFEASVVQGGEALLLPPGASGLAARDWQNASELSVEIATKPKSIQGIVPIAGLSAALRSLTPNCPSR